jgi:hypothetical protein
MTVLRAGPGISYHTAGVGYRADEFEAIFHTQDWEWLTVELEDGTHVWIKAQAVDFIYGGPSHLSQAKDIPPTYTPTSIGIPPTLTFTPLVGEYVEPVDVPDVPDTREPIMQPTTPRSTPQSESPSAQWNCSGDRYNCGDFSSCSSVMSYFRACPGDPSRLDGDNDGRPCESLCR